MEKFEKLLEENIKVISSIYAYFPNMESIRHLYCIGFIDGLKLSEQITEEQSQYLLNYAKKLFFFNVE